MSSCQGNAFVSGLLFGLSLGNMFFLVSLVVFD